MDHCKICYGLLWTTKYPLCFLMVHNKYQWFPIVVHNVPLIELKWTTKCTVWSEVVHNNHYGSQSWSIITQKWKDVDHISSWLVVMWTTKCTVWSEVVHNNHYCSQSWSIITQKWKDVDHINSWLVVMWTTKCTEWSEVVHNNQSGSQSWSITSHEVCYSVFEKSSVLFENKKKQPRDERVVCVN